MKTAYYANLVEGHHGNRDKIGGLPDHLPDNVPLSSHSGEEMAFLAQLYCTSDKLTLPGILCLQLYQIVEDYDPLPCVVALPTTAKPNSQRIGRMKPDLLPYDITWEMRFDPDEFPSPRTYSDEENQFARSKVGGITFFADSLESGDVFLGQWREGPEGLNFGGYTAILVRDNQGELQIRLG